MKSLQALLRLRWLGFAALVLPLVAAGVVLADSGAAHKTKQTLPIELGTSGGNATDISRAFCYGGTLGALVTDGAKSYILSNNHVLAKTNKGKIGDDIIQPGLIDVGCRANQATAVADLTRFQTIQFKKKGVAPNNTIDAAIAQVRSGAVKSDGTILDIGTISSSATQDSAGCLVRKSGRTTGDTHGSITAVDVTIDINYGSGQVARFTDQFLVGPASFSAGGDSGSLVVTEAAPGSAKAVGLLFAGSSEYTIANPIGPVLTRFGVSMVGPSAGGTDCPAAAASVPAARAAKNRNENQLLDLPGVAGVGVGAGGQVEVYIENENARARIPAHVDNVPVRVIVTGPFEAR